MLGFIPQTYQREVAGMPYIVVTSRHARGVSIVVTVPGMGPEEACDRVYPSEEEALYMAEGIARILMCQRANLGSVN